VLQQQQIPKRFNRKIRKGFEVINIGSESLVPLIEGLDFKAIDAVLKES